MQYINRKFFCPFVFEIYSIGTFTIPNNFVLLQMFSVGTITVRSPTWNGTTLPSLPHTI